MGIGQKWVEAGLFGGEGMLKMGAMANENAATGEWGELLAESYLRKEKGMRVLDRRWRHGHGELDLVMRSGIQMVFVEVRVRTGDGHPLQLYRSIGKGKWQVVRRTAIRYLYQCPWRPGSVRFDMIGIQRGVDGRLLRLTHWENVGVFGTRFRF